MLTISTAKMNFAIKTKFYNRIKYVLLPENKFPDYIAYVNKGNTEFYFWIFSKTLLTNMFLIKYTAVSVFGLNASELEGVFMWDRDGAEITVDNFAIVVNQFIHSNSFLIRMSISSKMGSPMLTQVQNIAHFIWMI